MILPHTARFPSLLLPCFVRDLGFVAVCFSFLTSKAALNQDMSWGPKQFQGHTGGPAASLWVGTRALWDGYAVLSEQPLTAAFAPTQELLEEWSGKGPQVEELSHRGTLLENLIVEITAPDSQTKAGEWQPCS